MPVQGIEWLLILIFFPILIVVVWWVYSKYREKKNRVLRALAVVRSKGKASIDDLIVMAMIPPTSVHEVVDELISKNLVNVVEEGGKIFYTVPQTPGEAFDNVRICPRCGYSNNVNANYCANCGARL